MSLSKVRRHGWLRCCGDCFFGIISFWCLDATNAVHSLMFVVEADGSHYVSCHDIVSPLTEPISMLAVLRCLSEGSTSRKQNVLTTHEALGFINQFLEESQFVMLICLPAKFTF